MALTITDIKNPIWSNAAMTAADCVATTVERGDVPFTASASDSDAVGGAVWAALSSGAYGLVAAYGGVAGAPLSQESLLGALAAHRRGVAAAGTTVEGVPVQTDPESRANLTAAYLLALSDASYTIQWKASDGNFYPLNAPTIRLVAQSVAAFIQKCFSVEAGLVAQIGDYTDTVPLLSVFDARMAS